MRYKYHTRVHEETGERIYINNKTGKVYRKYITMDGTQTSEIKNFCITNHWKKELYTNNEHVF